MALYVDKSSEIVRDPATADHFPVALLFATVAIAVWKIVQMLCLLFYYS